MALVLRQSRRILTPTLTSLRQWCQTLATPALASRRRQHHINVQYYYTKCEEDESTSHNRPLWTASVMGLFGIFGLRKKIENEEVTEGQLPLSFKKCYYRSEIALNRGDYKEAESQYHRALEILQGSPYVSTQLYIEAMAVIVYQLGNLYLELRDWDKAVNNLTETISLMLRCEVELESPEIIEISLKLGKALTNKKDYTEAEKTFSFTLSLAEKLLDKEESQENLALLGMCQHIKGQYHLMAGQYSIAFRYFSLALETAKKVYGEKDIQVAALISDCATALESIGDYKRAEKLLEEAINLSLSLPGSPDHEHMATLIMNLAAVINNQGRTSDAIDTYNRALAHAVKLSDKTISKEIKRRLQTLSSKL